MPAIGYNQTSVFLIRLENVARLRDIGTTECIDRNGQYSAADDFMLFNEIVSRWMDGLIRVCGFA